MPGQSVTVRVGELAIELPIRDSAHGRQVANEIGRALQSMAPLPVPPAAMQVGILRVDLPPLPPGASPNHLARLVVDGVHQALRRQIEAAQGRAAPALDERRPPALAGVAAADRPPARAPALPARGEDVSERGGGEDVG